MKKRVLLIVLIAVLAFSLTLAACKSCDHDYDENGICKKCGEADPDYQPPQELPTDIPASASTPTLMLHYKRSNPKDYFKWDFWIWKKGSEGVGCAINYKDDFGGVALYPLSHFDATMEDTLGIIPRLGGNSWTSKDVDADRMLDLSECQVDANNYIHIYLIEGDVNLYKDLDKLKYSASVEMSSTKIIVKTVTEVQTVKVYQDDALFVEIDGQSKTSISYTLPTDKNVQIGCSYTAEVIFATDATKTTTVSVNLISAYIENYDTAEFAANYVYDGELGAIYSAEQTTFRVWSPVSSRIVLNVYQSGHEAETPATVEMTKGEKGVFEATVEGDCDGKYYTYTVYNGLYPNGAEIVDPYAKSAGLSGVRGMVVNFAKTNPDNWDTVAPKKYDRKELVVWETHVADVTSSKTWTGNEAYRKKFLGVIQPGTTYSQGGVTVSTGFDHIKELGVNAVQLVPVFDQANAEDQMTFNWGYNPLNYNVLEGGYSTDATDGYVRIREFKQLVQAFSGANINVIMDVVYNHVNAAIGSNFDVLMPGYYFRYNSNNKLSNGSGCGNETASDRAMFRKFMIDSVCFWASEYKLGGFRFDLMGLHDLDTMELLVDALEKINPNVVVYGEPWTGGSTTLPSNKQAVQANGDKFKGYGQFNDQMRDALIKGGMSGASEKGWITNTLTISGADVEKISYGLKGATNSKISDPNKTVNYVTCHDNYTLFDRIHAAGINDAETVKKMAVLANSVVFTSNGTTFMLAGEEFLRTKNVDGATADEVHNSYKSSYKVNELDYSLKIANADVFAVYRGLIRFKTTCSGLHLEQSEIAQNYVVTTLADGSAIQIEINDVANGRVYKVVHANGTAKDVAVDFAGYTLYLDTLDASLNTTTVLTANTAIRPYKTIIAYKQI